MSQDGYWATYTLNGREVVGYSDNDHPWNSGKSNAGLGQGIVLTANLQTDAAFGGDFMILQIGQFYLGVTDNNGVSSHKSNAGGGDNLDDGLAPDPPLSIGMDGLSRSARQLGSMQTSDWPHLSTPSDYQYCDIDASFTTYLMYNPGQSYNGVWIALYQVKWSVDLRADQANWGVNTAVPAPASVPSKTSGASFFPSWTYDTDSLAWQNGL